MIHLFVLEEKKKTTERACFFLIYISEQISQEKTDKKHEEDNVRVKSLSAKQNKTAGCWGNKHVKH